MHKGWRLFSWLLLIVIVVAVVVTGAIVLTQNNPLFGRYRAYSVITGSMKPTLPVGTLIISKVITHQSQVTVGSIITFVQPGTDKTLVTHRVVAIKNTEQSPLFVTQGDANQSPDPWLISYGSIKGMVIGSVPYVGHLAEFIRTKLGIVLLVVIPTLLLAFLEIRKILDLIVSAKLEAMSSKKHEKTVHSLILLLISSLSLGLFFASNPTYSLFVSAPVTIGGNRLVTAPKPDSIHVVINEVLFYPKPGKGDDCDTQDIFCDEWLELYNPTNSSINLSGWWVRDSTTIKQVITGDAQLGSHKYALVAAKPDRPFPRFWTPPFGTLIISVGARIGDGLQNAGDHVGLYNPDGVEVDSIAWGTGSGAAHYDGPITIGHSISRKSPGFDNNLGTDFKDTSPPTPGKN